MDIPIFVPEFHEWKTWKQKVPAFHKRGYVIAKYTQKPYNCRGIYMQNSRNKNGPLIYKGSLKSVLQTKSNSVSVCLAK
jgi:hypothetical protein